MVLLIVVLYSLAMIGIGWLYRGRAASSPEDFLVAGRSVGTLVGGGALAATYSSTSGFLGLLGLTYALGVAPALWANVGLLLGFLFTAVFLAPRLRRAGVLTLPQLLEQRFGPNARVACAVITVCVMFVYMIAQLQGGAYVMQFVLGVPYSVGVFIVGVVFIVYVLLGGSYSTVITSFWQNLMMTVAMVTVAVYALTTNDWQELVSQAAANKPFVTSLWGAPGPAFSWSFGLLLMLGVITAPHVLTRFYAAKDAEVAIKTATSAITWLSLFYASTLAVGIYIVAKFPVLENPDMGYFFAIQSLPAWVVGIFVAAVLAAAMSTTDAQLLTAASSVVSDIYVPLRKGRVSTAEVVTATRIAVAVIGALAVITTLRPPSLIALVMALAQSMMVGAFFGPIVLGLWWRRVTPTAVLVGMIGGFFLSVLSHPAMQLVRLPSPFFAGSLGAAVGLLLMAVITLASPGSHGPGAWRTYDAEARG